MSLSSSNKGEGKGFAVPGGGIGGIVLPYLIAGKRGEKHWLLQLIDSNERELNDRSRTKKRKKE